MSKLKLFLGLLFLMCSTQLQIFALDPTSFDDVELQKRYQVLTEELRCLVCQNETIAGSSSDLAIDLRQQVAEQLKAGSSDEQIRTYMTERYGDFIHYRPPNDGRTKLLWLAPGVFLLLFTLVFVVVLRKGGEKVDSEVSK